MGIGRIITSDVCIEEGAAILCEIDPLFQGVINDLGGPIPLRRQPDGFAALLKAIVGQQVSVASASATWMRLEVANLTSIGRIKQARDEDLAQAGLSRSKIKYARFLAEADVDYSDLRQQPDQVVIERLVQVKGIGSWTAEIYAMFSLGRADVFAHGDLALQEATRQLLDLPNRPTEKEMRSIAQRWSPWRAVAARVLWAYYAQTKAREGIL